MRALVLRTIAGVGSLLAVLAVATPAHAAFPGSNGDIAFHSNRDGNFEIYTMEADGSAETRRTVNTATDVSPAWSPDGTKIAFASNRDGNYEIYTMNADGTAQTRRTSNPGTDGGPAWSPDGTMLVFGSDRDGNSEIYAMNWDGSGAPTRLTNNGSVDGEPAWSPKGDKIAFISNRDGNFEIYSTNANGTGTQARLTNNAAEDRYPSWSPDGKKIVFASDRSGIMDPWTMDSDGFSLTQSNVSNWATTEPAWAPDKGGTVFEIAQSNGDIASSSGGLLVNNSAADGGPDWQPVITSYARPAAATPKYDALVLSYKSCTTTNSTHEAPVTGFADSCVPAVQASDYLTVGTADANGAPTKFIGSTRMSVVPGNPMTPGNEADVKIAVSVKDVRNKNSLTDYTGQVTFRANLRITDKRNAPTAYSTPGTLDNTFALAVNLPCVATTDTTVGSTCSVNTAVNTVYPNAVKEGKRSIWEVNDVRVLDGGVDGNPASVPNTVFATSGLFIP